MSVEQQIAELEMRLMFQDDTIQALNDALVEQQRQLDQLRTHISLLSRRQDELNQRLPDGALGEEPPPPHY